MVRFSMDLELGNRQALARGPTFVRTLKRSARFTGDLIRLTGGAIARSPLAAPIAAGIAEAGVKRYRKEVASMRRYRRRARVTRRGRRGGSASIVTRQRDNAVTYRSRRGRGRSGRGGRRFRARVMQTVNSMQPMQIWTSEKSQSGACGLDTQQVFGLGIYQTKATSNNDLQQIFTAAGLDVSTATNRSAKICIKSVCMDVQIHNNSSDTAIIDVYEIMCVKDPETSSDLNVQFQTFFNENTTITSKAWNNVAVSAFENPDFCRHYKVLNKREVLLPSDEIFSLQMRSGKDRVITGDRVERDLFCIPKLGRFFLFMWHGPPDPNAGGAGIAGNLNVELTFSWQKAYKYSIMPGKQTGGVTNTT